jgi:hypothetical protein
MVVVSGVACLLSLLLGPAGGLAWQLLPSRHLEA